MYGEGYDWAQQYSVSSGDFVGSLPVGMQSAGDTDLPYWPSQNMYVYKEVWVHSTSRWLWMMQDLLGPAPRQLAPSTDDVRVTMARDGTVTIRLTTQNRDVRTYALRTDGLVVNMQTRTVVRRPGGPGVVEWKAKPVQRDAFWMAVALPDGDLSRRLEITAPAAR
jgi:hypothetical protein